MALKISESAAVQMPMKTVASLIAIIAIGTWAYFGIHEKLNQHSTKIELMQKDLDQNSEFRIKYPRGELGQSAGEAELFMIVEHVSGLLEDVETEIKGMRNNAVNIEFLKKRTEKLTEDVEKIKQQILWIVRTIWNKIKSVWNKWVSWVFKGFYK